MVCEFENNDAVEFGIEFRAGDDRKNWSLNMILGERKSRFLTAPLQVRPLEKLMEQSENASRIPKKLSFILFTYTSFCRDFHQ